MTQSTHKISNSDVLHVLHMSMSGKYLKHHKASFRTKYLDTFSAHRNSMVLTVKENSSPKTMVGLLLDRLSPYYVLENLHLGS